MFKVGDLVLCVEDKYSHRLKKGSVYKISMSHDYYVITTNDYGLHDIWRGDRFIKVYELNPINRLLYPDYEIFTHKEKKYLKPKEM